MEIETSKQHKRLILKSICGFFEDEKKMKGQGKEGKQRGN
jgi:hypothetical protein